jgi:hypothetical protein
VRNGKAHMILKTTTKRRRTKEEIEAARGHDNEEKKHMATLMQTESLLGSKRIRIETVPSLMQQHEELTQLLKSKNLLGEDGQLKEFPHSMG